MEYLYEYLQYHMAPIIFACINIVFFLATMIIACTENKNALKLIIGYIIFTACTIAGTIIFDSVAAMFASVIFWMVSMFVICCGLLLIIGLLFATSKIYLVFRRNKQHDY